ncbi:MAG: DUF6153 family protein [Pseudonocardiaceae bacterium]
MIRPQWLLIVVIAAGLVGMHHLVHVHSAHTKAMANAMPTAHPHPGPIGVTPVALASPAAPQADCCDPMNMVGHSCLAVLTAITALVVALILAAMRRRPLKPGSPLATVIAVAARAPPDGGPALTQLCVLRC